MKIAQIVFSLVSGGAEKFVVNLSNELAQLGHEVTVVALRDDNNEGYSFNKRFLNTTVNYHCMGFSSSFSLSMALRLGKYIKKEEFEIAHSHLSTLVAVPFLISCLVKRELKVVHTVHSVYTRSAHSFKGKVFSFCCNHKLMIPIAISEQCQSLSKKHFGVNELPLINNGCPDVTKSLCYDSVVDELSSIHLTKGPLFVHVARYDQIKNQELLVDSFNRLYGEMIPFKLLVIGHGFDSEDARDLVENACENIHFLGEKTNVGDYLLQADAFCMTSHYEGLPISMLEAMSVGLTPICTPVGGIPDVITDGKTGYLSAGMSVDDYCAAIKRFIASPIDKELLKKYFLDNYSMTKCALQYEQLYDEIVHNKKG